MSRNQKFLIGGVVVLLTAILGGGAYYYFTRPLALMEGGGGQLPAGGDAGVGGLQGLFRPDSGVKDKPRLVRLADEPVAGISAVRGGRVRYIKKETGHVYEISGNGDDLIRISNTTIPRVFNAVWSESGESITLSFFDDNYGARHFSAILTGTSTEGVFLPALSGPAAYLQGSERLLYYAQNGDSYSLITADRDNKNQKAVYSSPFRDFLAGTAAADTFSLLSRPSGAAMGYLYTMNAAGENFKKILGNLRGLNVKWSPSGEFLLVSGYRNESFETSVFDKNGELIDFLPPILPEKCVWNKKDEQIIYCGVPKIVPAALYPDDWYKGKIIFDDQLAIITDIGTGAYTEILFPDQPSFDIKEIVIDSEGEYLYFIDKNDETLWSLRL